jgi:hypothetical protein
VMAAQVSNDDGEPVLFSGVPGEADQQYTQLNGVLSGLGMTADTEVTILSDGADGPRSLGEAASIGTVFHVLDWFHLAMRVQHVAQCASGWPNATVRARRDGARFADAVEHIRWRLWRGQTERALRLIQRTLAGVEAKMTGKTAAARSAAKLTKALIALETYVSGLADLIIDYALARLDDEPFSTSPPSGHAVAAASPDGGAAADAVVGARRSFDASGSHSHRQRHVRHGSSRHLPASPLISHDSMIAPMFGTVSCVPEGQLVSSGHDWREHQWQADRWQEHEAHKHAWRGYAPPAVAYAPPGYYAPQPTYYAPPPAYYAPPPAYYPAPGISIGFGFR